VRRGLLAMPISSTLAVLATVTLIAADPAYDGLVEKYSHMYGVSAEIVYSVLWVESRARADSVSRAQAMGLMQLRFATAKAVLPLRVRVPSDLFDPDINIHVGTAYLRALFDRSVVKGVKGWRFVLGAYNVGVGAVEREYARTGRLPASAQRYVAAVEDQLWIQFGKHLADIHSSPGPVAAQLKGSTR
jgi:soluble lytic murein transglycosylase-like protein